MIAGDFLRDVKRGILPNRRKLVSEILIQSLKPIRERDNGLTVRSEDDDAIIDILHVRALDEGVIEVLVGRIERMINLERPSSFAQRPDNLDIAREMARFAAVALSPDSKRSGTDVGDSNDRIAIHIGRLYQGGGGSAEHTCVSADFQFANCRVRLTDTDVPAVIVED